MDLWRRLISLLILLSIGFWISEIILLCVVYETLDDDEAGGRGDVDECDSGGGDVVGTDDVDIASE